ncbi:MAG: UDP-N-acetylmuramate dehydrogenase [Candidatus Chaera renei]|uniref:UDP-N-acetylenolpyruvoylglucosamine reductase n=1 Tax=Candidatus Chaera renei TaxID=2506947 RepID=A0A4Q0AFR7_9BACT|nr:MAG: UDP-N-acetylmuramate dehydrogenase [Candidatus Chaera renei]
MKLGRGAARFLAVVQTKDELEQAISWAQADNIPVFILGDGSNVIISDNDFEGLVIINRLSGFKILEQTEAHVDLLVGAGENWDSVVERAVEMNLSGIEAMSRIPGTAGATPVQNVGAYGQEIADTLQSLEAYDLTAHGNVRLMASECGFSYRFSIFKNPGQRRYVITSITLRLSRSNPRGPYYNSLQNHFDERGISQQEVTPQLIRQAVTDIRSVKLPDPKIMANTGSFFKNPMVDSKKFTGLAAAFPDIVHYKLPDGKIKLAAGWLIERAGLKGYGGGGLKTFEHNALVIVNQTAKTYDELKTFSDHIIETVRRKFGVTLEREPELL